METNEKYISNWPTLKNLPLPAKALITAVIVTMNIAMAGAAGQIIVHDIIPTFFSDNAGGHHSEMVMQSQTDDHLSSERGDLFSDLKDEPVEKKPFYKNEQFIWTLKWTHIHLFGINMIFIFMGAITLLLDIDLNKRTWLIILPFMGILVDIAAMWLKGFVSPAFFWMHLPGGGLFGAIFVFVTIRGFWEMWWDKSTV